jgi:WD40 repeat-containing protein SMU1
MSSLSNNSDANELDIPSADILRLILTHLTESNLHQSCQALSEESGVRMAGLVGPTKGQLVLSAEGGRWGECLQILAGLDLQRYRKAYIEDYCKARGVDDGDNGDAHDEMVTPLEKVVSLAHEITILELADRGEVELAYATLRVCSEMLDKTLPVHGDDVDNIVACDAEQKNKIRCQRSSNDDDTNFGIMSSRSGDIERRITALLSLRSSGADTSLILPTNYYGPSNQTQQKRRYFISKLLRKHVPEAPMQRLSSLLQQSVKWQCFTGAFPAVQKLFQDRNEDDEDDEDDGKKKKKKRKTPEQKFDLVLGNVDIVGSSDKKHKRKSSATKEGAVERIPTRARQTIRLGKNSYIESAIFLPDGRGIVTGSSDGFIEVWGEPTKSGDDDGMNSLLQNDIDYGKLRTSDLQYQKNDELMIQDGSILSLDVSRDGTMLASASSDGSVCVWKIADGRLLRKLERTHGGRGSNDQGCAVTCIQFSSDGSKVLTGGHDSTCREFGLLNCRMTKQFRGHKSYINCCSYIILPNSSIVIRSDSSGERNFLAVVTASADGTVRIWNGRSAEPLQEIIPPLSTSNNAPSVHDNESIHTVIHLHSPPYTMIVVPRHDRAFLMSLSGSILQAYVRDDAQGTVFLAATVSQSNQWLYISANDGKCIVFDVNLGKVEKILKSFTEECIGRSDTTCEISGLLHHPHDSLVGGYSNNKSQKRGILSIWK